MPENDPNKTYEHLKSCVAKVITMQEQKKNLAEREALLVAKEQRRDLKVAAAATTKVNASENRGQSKSNVNSDKTSKTERGRNESTPNAKGKGSGEVVSGDAGRRSSTPGAKAKAVGVSRAHSIPCSFFLQGKCFRGENCLFSHTTQQVDSKSGTGQSASAERGKSSPNEKGKRSTSKSKNLTCFKFLKGNCDAGDSCRWLHIKEDGDGKDLQRTTKSDGPVIVEILEEVSMPCIVLDSESEDEDDRIHVAGVCTEICAASLKEDDDRILIGRRHFAEQGYCTSESVDAGRVHGLKNQRFARRNEKG